MFSRIFFDTAPLIYFLEKIPVFYEKTRDFIYENYNNNVQFYTSVISDMEYSVIPYRENNASKILNYNEFIKALSFKKIDITNEIADKAALLRGTYDFLKGADALQLASAILYGCDYFFTNDKLIKKISEIKVILVSEL